MLLAFSLSDEFHSNKCSFVSKCRCHTEQKNLKIHPFSNIISIIIPRKKIHNTNAYMRKCLRYSCMRWFNNCQRKEDNGLRILEWTASLFLLSCNTNCVYKKVKMLNFPQFHIFPSVENLSFFETFSLIFAANFIWVLFEKKLVQKRK